MANKEYKMGVIGLGMGINMLPVNNRNDIPIKVTQISGVPAQKEMMAEEMSKEEKKAAKAAEKKKKEQAKKITQ